MASTAVRRSVAGLALASALAITLAACGQDAVQTDDAATTSPASELTGNLAGAGASSMESAQNAWIAQFTAAHPGVSASYDPVGSGGGREQFIAGTTLFAGSDSALNEEEVAAATERCFGSEPIELPLYVSPIAIIYNVPGVDAEHINLTPDTIARMFKGEITNWNDPAIAESNPGVELPDLPVIPVNRSDESGTTDNFTEYLAAAAPEVWTWEADKVWPIEGTQSGAQTSGMIDVVSSAEGTIGYADASRAGDLGTVAVGVGDEFVPFSPQAAAQILQASQPAESATDLRLVFDLARDTTESGTYPVVLVSYSIACSQYDNEQDAANVAAYLRYVAGPEGQELAASPDVAGIAPITDSLRDQALAAIDQITAG